VTLSYDDLDEITKRARPGRAFSNSTEYEIWSHNWCDRCTLDADFKAGKSDIGCPLLLVILGDDVTPAEWLEQPIGSPDRYHCIEFRSPDDGPGPEPQPQPEPPNMDGLFARPERHARMFVQPQPAEVSA